MEQIIVTRLNGTTYPLASRHTATAIKSAKQTWELLGSDVVNVEIESPYPQVYSIGDKITIFGRVYKLNRMPKAKKTGAHMFSYDLEFEGIQYDLLRATYDLTIDTTNNQLQDIQADTLTGNLNRFATVLIANANRVFPGKWALGSCPDTETLTLTFGESDNCLSVLQNLCSESNFHVEFQITENSGVYYIQFLDKVGQIIPYTFEYGRGKGLYSLDSQSVDSSNIITRLKVYGSTANITSKYRASRLCLPGCSKAQSYIEKPEAVAAYGIFEATKYFDNIKPTFNGTVTGLVSGSVVKFVDTAMFDLNALELDGVTPKYLMPGVAPKVHFNTGNLAGYEFEVEAYDTATHTFTLIKQTDENGYEFPSSTSVAFQFGLADEYKILDVALPEQYVTDAENRLFTEGDTYYDQNSQPKVQYGLSITKDYLKSLYPSGATVNIFQPGDYIHVVDADIGVDKSLRIKSLTRNILDEYDYSLTISDTVTISIINRVISELVDHDNIIQINNLNNPARARANWRSSREVLNMVFDTEGDYYTEKIKPNSIETSMLAVGAKSMQFTLKNTKLYPNFEGNVNYIEWNGGILIHFTIDESAARSWNLANGGATLGDSSLAYYIYAKCEKVGTAGSIIFSTEQIQVESDANYYHFLVGVLNSVDVETSVRTISLMYGFSTINGRYIKTGRVQSADGQTYFDLDLGEIGGKIVFRSGNDDQTVENNISYARNIAISAQSIANDAQLTADSASTSANIANALLADIASDSKLTPLEKQSTKQEWDIIVSEKIKIDAQADVYGVSKTAYGTAYTTLSTYITPLLSDLTTTSNIVGTTFRTNFKNYYDARQDILNAISSAARDLANAAQTSADLLEVSLSGAVFADTFNESQSQFNSRWTNYDGSGNPTIIPMADATGGNALVVGDNSGNDHVYLIGNKSIPYDPNKLYMVKARLRRLAGTGIIYVGIAGRDYTDTQWVNVTGDNSISPQHYFAAAGANPANEWMEYVGYFKGLAASGNGVYEPNPLQPGTCHSNVRFIRPLLLVNYQYQPGIVEVDYIMIDFADAQGAQATANSKNRHFITTPTTPYYIGDTFTDGIKLYRCKTQRLTGSYTASDWELATTFDNTKTTIEGGLVTSGTVQVGSEADGGVNVKAGMTGQGSADTDTRFWAGAPFVNRGNAPFRVNQRGDMAATAGSIAGWEILSGKIRKVDGDYEVEISAEGKMIRFCYQGEDKIVLTPGALPSLSSLISPTSGTINPTSKTATFTGDGTYSQTTGTFTIPDSHVNLTMYFGQTPLKTAAYWINCNVYLGNASGQKLMLIGNVNRLVRYGVESSNNMRFVAEAGTYTLKYEWVITSATGLTEGTFYPINFTYTSQRQGTIMGSNGIANYWSTSKYFYLSQSALSYFLEGRGGLKWISPGSTSVYLELSNTNIIMAGLPTRNTETVYRLFVDANGKVYKRSASGE